MGRPTVEIELAGDAQFARDLAVGGVFVPGCALKLTDECELVVRGANHQITLPARVVYVEEHRGAGLELIGFSSETKIRLAALAPVPLAEQLEVDERSADEQSLDRIELDRLDLALAETDPPADSPADSVAVIDIEALIAAADPDDDLALAVDDGSGIFVTNAPTLSSIDFGGELGRELGGELGRELGRELEDDTLPPEPGELGDDAGDASLESELVGALAGLADGSQSDAAIPLDGEPDGTGAASGEPRSARAVRFARNVHERLRGLNLVAQLKIASSGELHERIVLERLYSKNVWETLLRNPRLTAPEIARIARMGSLPRVLLEIIVSNNAWLQVPEVRRALLSNPRLGTDQIVKVLRLTPKHELRLAAMQTAYPYAVRNAAKLLLRSD